MKIFISWSGTKSHAVAELLEKWLQDVIQAAKPWISSKDIDKGSLWFGEISNELKETSLGIICITQENKERPWILFEAGALARGITSQRVCTLLIDLESAEVENPLAQFNHTLPIKTDMLNLLKTINKGLGDNALTEPRIEKSFETHWPEFEAKLSEIKSTQPAKMATKRNTSDIISEVLDTVRAIDRRISNLTNKRGSGPGLYEYSPFAAYSSSASKIGYIDENERIKNGRRFLETIDELTELAGSSSKFRKIADKIGMTKMDFDSFVEKFKQAVEDEKSNDDSESKRPDKAE